MNSDCFIVYHSERLHCSNDYKICLYKLDIKQLSVKSFFMVSTNVSLWHTSLGTYVYKTSKPIKYILIIIE